MKKGINILTFGFALATLTGCGDFLTQEAQDLVIPKTVTQYKELLQGDGYFKNLQTTAAWVHFLTDDMATGPYEYADDPTKISSYMEKYKQIFLWQAEIESDQFTDDLYAYLYNQALPGTICLEMLDDMEGSDTEKRILKGQASFQRAMAFFYLANLYGPAYNEAQGSDPCVPMSLTATATPGSYPRKTVEEVWGQIHTDITTAVECLDGYEAGVYEINYKAALLLASRVALFMENYEEAITYAERLLELAPTLFDMVGKIDIETYLDPGKYSSEGILNTNLNPDEILWTFSQSSTQDLKNLLTDTSFTSMSFTVSNTEDSGLIQLYDRNKDVRMAFSFVDPDPDDFLASLIGCMSGTYVYSPCKYNSYAGMTGFPMGMRNAEAYLTLAEAYARKANPDKSRALDYLNALLKTRIVDYTPLTEADFATDQELVERIWTERRKELCFEELHRWWDMRRCGQKGFTRVWGVTGETYEIADHDPAFTLNFPKKERDFDPGLTPNNRPIRTPVASN